MNDKTNGSKNGEQLKLRFPTKALSFGDMCISEANETAFSIIRGCENWPTTSLCLIGPAASGLTTAALAWAEEQKAKSFLPAELDELTHDEIEAIITAPVAIDRADLISNASNLLYLINRAQSYGTHVLLTGCQPPSTWKTSNADLHSRLSAMPIAELLEPDEELLKARLSAACRRRYVRLPDEVAAYLAARMSRSYSAIEDLAARLDKAMEEGGRKLTIPLAREVLAEGASNLSLFDDEDD